MDKITIECLDCGHSFKVTENEWFADSVIMCPECDGESFNTPSLDDYIYIAQV